MWKVILAMKIIKERDALQNIERNSISLFKLNFTMWFWQWKILSRVFMDRCLHHKCWWPNNHVEQDIVMTFLLELAHHPTFLANYTSPLFNTLCTSTTSLNSFVYENSIPTLNLKLFVDFSSEFKITIQVYLHCQYQVMLKRQNNLDFYK